MRLNEKVALITGGAAGIGKATAQRFVEEGARVVICDVNQSAGEATVEELGPQASYYQVDVSDRTSVEKWIDDVSTTTGHLDVLVNNAGILRDSLYFYYKFCRFSIYQGLSRSFFN